MVCSVALLAIGCTGEEEETGAPNDADLTQLLQSWVHLFEEEAQGQTDAVHWFRPDGFKEFPPSRFRMRYSFRQDGECEWLFLHPGDAHFMKQGTWEGDPQNSNVILIYDTDGTLMESVSFRIVDIAKDLLRVRRGRASSEDG
jgi:hypothetical protein